MTTKEHVVIGILGPSLDAERAQVGGSDGGLRFLYASRRICSLSDSSFFTN